MNLTNKKYLFDLMQKENFVFFAIYNTQGSIMRDQNNEAYTQEEAVQDLQNFFEYNSGLFRIDFRRTRTITPRTIVHSFTVENSFEPEEKGIGNVDPTNMNSSLMEVIREKDQKIERLQTESLAQIISGIQKTNELQMELLRTELKNKSGGNDEMLMQAAMTTLGGLFGGSNIGVSGFDSVETAAPTPAANMDPAKQKINSAVVRLMKVDSNFADHISKLADLAEKNMAMYSMAISQLKNL